MGDKAWILVGVSHHMNMGKGSVGGEPTAVEPQMAKVREDEITYISIGSACELTRERNSWGRLTAEQTNPKLMGIHLRHTTYNGW